MKAKVVNCKKLGIRKAPWIPEEDPEIVAVIPKGEVVTIKSFREVYDWTGKRFYKIETESGVEGYAIVDVLKAL